MAEKMLQFTKVSRAMPAKRPATDRAADFDEIYADFSPVAAKAQASRCSQCGVPFCQQGCPLTNNIPDWLKLAAEGRMEEAWRVSSATNNMPEICGRICPQDRLCEGICTIEQSGHGTVTIGRSRSTSPTRPGPKAGSSRSAARVSATGQPHHQRRSGQARRRRAARRKGYHDGVL